jgi:hypothetical protein
MLGTRLYGYCALMHLVLGMSAHTGKRLAEVGFLLVLIAGAWYAAAEVPALRWASARRIVAGIVLAAAGLVLIVAVHFGHFG